jgi:tetratricopeptide (TPR) repeat protein
MSKHFLCLPFSCLLLDAILAQTPSTPASQKHDYSQESFVVEQSSSEIVVENDGTNERKSSIRVRMQSDAGVQQYAVLTFGYQSSTESLEIDYVRVRKPDASLVLTPLDTVQDLASEVTRQAPMYSDLREKHVAVKGLGVGDALEYQAHWKTTKPLAPGQFWFPYNFSHDFIVLAESLRIDIPRDRPVKWKSPASKPTITEAGARRIFAWTGSQLEPKSKEEEKKDREAQTYQTGRGRLPQPEIQFSSFSTWEEVGAWYNGLQRERAKSTPEVRSKAAEVTKGLTDDRAKAQAIYQYVSSQIHYVGIDLGIGRYQPHFAAEVLGNQYGDCKDKHTLLAALLEAVGIQASPVLIASLNALDPDVPSPSQFDHLISAVRLGDKLAWLDTTAEVAPFEYLVDPLRGKTALIVPPDKPASLITTPPNPPSKGLETFRIDAKMSDTGTLEGKIERSLQESDAEVLMRMLFRRMSVSQWKDLTQQISLASGFSGEVSEVTASSPEKTDEPFHFAYKYVRKDFPDWANRRIGAALPPIGLPAIPENDEKPLNPIWLGSPSEIRYESHVELPKGYRPVLPKDLDIVESFGEYHRADTWRDGVFTTERRLSVKSSEVPATEYEAYKKFVKAVTEDYASTISLRSGAWSLGAYQDDIWELPYSDNKVAAQAYDDAREKYTKNDVQGEIAALKQAVETDPKFTRAWLWLGEIYKSNRQPNEALEAYRKAIEVDPQQAVSYRALAYTLLSMRRPGDAVPVWRQLIKVAASDPAGPEGLGSALLDLKQYKDAVSPLETAARMYPESAGMHIQLGKAYLHAGEPAKAITSYQKALELDPSPLLFNDAAYELAEQNQELPLALEYAKRAAYDEGAVSRKVDLAKLRPEDFAPTRNLPAFWDTLGWVYFKIGDLDQAEKYLNAAWVLSQGAVEGYHLGQVYERRNDKQAAVHTYRLALSRVSEKDYGGADLMGEIRQRLGHLSPELSDADPHNDAEIKFEMASMQARKIPLDGLEGVAHFLLVFERDQKTSSAVVGDVRFIGGSETLKQADTVLRSTDFKFPIPADGNPRLLRHGVLFCSSAKGCVFSLATPEAEYALTNYLAHQ